MKWITCLNSPGSEVRICQLPKSAACYLCRFVCAYKQIKKLVNCIIAQFPVSTLDALLKIATNVTGND